MEDAKARIDALFGTAATEDDGAGEAGQHQAQVKALALVEKAERMLENAADEDREDMIDLIERIKDGLAAQDAGAVEAASDRLADILYYLEN